MIKKNDFIEIDFTAKIKEGNIFDTTSVNEAKKAEIFNKKQDYKPLRICVGQGMVIKGLDSALEGKEIGKEYVVNIEPEQAFGKRDPRLIRIMPLSMFREKEVMPYPGLMLNMDGMVVRIASVSGGRVIADFNNPLAGKKIEYKFNIKKEITDKKEKLLTLIEFYLKLNDKDVEIENNIITIKDKNIASRILASKKIIKFFVDKIKELLNLDVELKEKEQKQEKEKEQKKS